MSPEAIVVSDVRGLLRNADLSGVSSLLIGITFTGQSLMLN